MKPTKSRVFSAIILVGTGLLSWWVKSNYNAVLQEHHGIAIAVYTAVFFIVVIVLASFDKLWIWVWNRFIKWRRFWARVAGVPFLEGWWVDVGIDSTGGRKRLINYSSIVIRYENEGYEVEGTSWQFLGGDPEGSRWRSEHCEIKGRKLTFWYTGFRPGLDYGKAEYIFSGGRSTHPTGFEGNYGDNNFRTQGKFKDFEEAEEAKSAAIKYMQDFRNENGYDASGLLSLAAPSDLLPEERWYRVFVRDSDKKDQEVRLLGQMITKLPGRPINTILDIGPAEGDLTRAVLGRMTERGLLGSSPSYLAVEPSGAHLGILPSSLPNLNLTLVKSRFEDYLPQLKSKFDLILLLNVLYYVNSADELCKNVADLLSPGGFVLSLHTDIQSERFLHELIGYANPNLDQAIVEKVARSGGRTDMELLAPEKGRVTLRFPEIGDAMWYAIGGGDPRSRDETIIDAMDLICFLVDMGVESLRKEGKWQKAVAQVREHLRDTGNTVGLPIVAQLLTRKL